MKVLLEHAASKGYAVGQFNATDLDFLDAILTTAVERRSALIIGIAEVHFKHMNLELLSHVVHRAALAAPIPVAVNLDHGKTLEGVMSGIRNGFTSIMFDGSSLPFEENLAATAEVARIAHAAGVTVEGEVGHVGGGEGQLAPTAASEELFTDPNEAVEFVKRTGVDCLAVSVGNVHGLYRGEPKIDFERIRRIHELVNVPLVLHGGSGISDQDFRRAIECGMAKVNIYTDMQIRARNKILECFANMKERTTYIDLMHGAREGVKEEVEHKMEVFGSEGLCGAVNPVCDFCGACETCQTRGAKGTASAPICPTRTEDSLVSLIAESVLRTLREKGN
jgi:fructose-bisphosphate aldolase class II